MILKQTVLVASASTFILALLSSTVVYFYSSYARPEAVNPKKLQEDLDKRKDNFSEVVKSIKARFPDNLKVGASDSVVVDTMDLGPRKPLKDNEIKIFFKNILSSVVVFKKESEDDAIKPISPIKFPPIKIADPPSPIVPKSFQCSDKVFIGQVGLSLYTDTFFAAVYRIQNLFGKSGLVGHFFVMDPNLDWDTFTKFNIEKYNFSSKEGFKKHFTGQKITDLSSSDDKIFLILINNKIPDIVTSVLGPDDIKGGTRTEVNPYKWLYLSTKLMTNFSKTEPPSYALIFPKDEAQNHDEIIYPSDVRVFELDWMKDADVSLHSGCIKRIENHCRDYLLKDKITL